MATERRDKGSFVAVSELTGEEQMFRVVVDVFVTKTHGGTHKDEGPISITASDGAHVNRLEKGRYEVVRTGEVFVSNAPNPP